MKITLKGIFKVLAAILPFLPGGLKAPHAGVTIGRILAGPPGGAGTVSVSGIAVNIDAAFLAHVDGAEDLAKIVDPTNAVLFIVSGENADRLRAALGLPAVPPVAH